MQSTTLAHAIANFLDGRAIVSEDGLYTQILTGDGQDILVKTTPIATVGKFNDAAILRVGDERFTITVERYRA